MFDVDWTDEATDDLSQIWVKAHREDRSLISAAVNEIESTLASVADTAGESRASDVRILIVDQVAVQYVLNEDDREAVVVKIWRTTERSGF